jgi:hypothetical protein
MAYCTKFITLKNKGTQLLNKYQKYFLGGKCGRYVWLTTCHLHVSIVLKSGSLNFMEPSGPVQACNGTALPSPCTKYWSLCHIFMCNKLTPRSVHPYKQRTLILVSYSSLSNEKCTFEMQQQIKHRRCQVSTCGSQKF